MIESEPGLMPLKELEPLDGYAFERWKRVIAEPVELGETSVDEIVDGASAPKGGK